MSERGPYLGGEVYVGEESVEEEVSEEGRRIQWRKIRGLREMLTGDRFRNEKGERDHLGTGKERIPYRNYRTVPLIPSG